MQPPHEQGYFTRQEFDTSHTMYNDVPSDSEGDLYLMRYGRRKPKAWPWSEHGFEYEKARVRKRINSIRKHHKMLKERHQEFMGPKKDVIIDSDNEALFAWVKWLNPQDGKSYLKGQQAAKRATLVLAIEGDNDAAEDMAMSTFGPHGVGNFNDWVEEGWEGEGEEEEHEEAMVESTNALIPRKLERV